MEFENIKELINIFNNSDIDKLKLEDGDFKFSLERNNTVFVEQAVQQKAPLQSTETPIQTNNSENKEEGVEDYYVFKAPLVGTFYAAPSPSSSPYVKVGDTVEVDQVICIIEAMKMINEIKSPVKGKIVEILVSNEDLVEFDTPIYKIEAENV
ncbi:acetyl-CoA carboxylase biotin carboxyl carrier protein [Miniphocaeibacter halophilus]|uniref:Acetyl-CoA carboxylase biotin carboxyl carrier protein n=1 Tax=Miniphocaeibacter halophilus TaxID=2931922 RepID=A0AC61MR69_9FIRM|nr:acetyl-CoA carboxylase biotin carboxyl carrier protein [Miniphocaeibacter halophilus]QQK08150.1 acetyl-CoA carboxylase biotin carboxyl carrier protein [Miniphocaeibacter halophilus]